MSKIKLLSGLVSGNGFFLILLCLHLWAPEGREGFLIFIFSNLDLFIRRRKAESKLTFTNSIPKYPLQLRLEQMEARSWECRPGFPCVF